MNPNQKELDKIYNEISLEVYLHKSDVKEIVEDYYQIIKDIIEKVDIDDLENNKLPIFQLPIIGKLVVQPYKQKRIIEARNKKYGKD